MNDQIYTGRGVAKYLKISRSKIYYLIQRDRYPT